MRIAELLTYLALRVVIAVLQTLSLETCVRWARVLARVTHEVIRFRQKVTQENLRHAFPQLSDLDRQVLARQMWEHLYLLVAEIAQAPRKIHRTNWRRYVTFHDAPTLVRALLDERPLLLVSAHFGNFELAGFLMGIMGFPTYSVARTLDNEHINNYLNRFRGATGQHIVAKKGGYQQILDVLSRGGTLALLADQYAGSKGCWVEFFSRPASTHKAIALFALAHCAPLVVGYAVRQSSPLHYKLGVEAYCDPTYSLPQTKGVRELTQWYTLHLENMIRRAPAQYWWVHRRWKDRRPAKRLQRAA